MVSRQASGAGEVHRITTVPAPLADDVARRTRRYLAQMTVRLVCFLGAVLTWDLVPAWLSAVLLVGAVVLPYIAVILANAGQERRPAPGSLMPARELGSAPSGPTGAGSGPGAAGVRAERPVRGEW